MNGGRVGKVTGVKGSFDEGGGDVSKQWIRWGTVECGCAKEMKKGDLEGFE